MLRVKTIDMPRTMNITQTKLHKNRLNTLLNSTCSFELEINFFTPVNLKLPNNTKLPYNLTVKI